MLRFLGQFQADFQLKSGWIEPLLVGGYAPFSPSVGSGKGYDGIDSLTKKSLDLVEHFCEYTKQTITPLQVSLMTVLHA